MNGTTTAQLAEKTAKAVTGSVEEWTGFLQSAARLYKYSYPEQLLIYAQRPDATACASYEIWNQTMRRYVRRGARGIALPDGAGAVRYVFDVADTGARKSSREVKTWSLDENNREAVAHALETQYGSAAKLGIAGQLEEIAMQQSMDYWQWHQDELRGIVDGSFLEGYDELNLEIAFRNTAAASVKYMLLSRCNLAREYQIEPEELAGVLEWNTSAASGALGSAVSELSEGVLRQIERTIRQYERSQNHDERTDVYEERRVLDSRPDSSRTADGAEQIRTDAGMVSEGASDDHLQQPAPEREADRAPDGNRSGGGESDGGNHAGAGEAGGRDGSAESERPDVLGRADEHLQGASRGSDPRGADLRITEPVQGEQTSFMPEAENVQTSSASSVLDYNSIKEAHPDDIVLYQVGDFFEMYGEDARQAAELLDMNLTTRNIPDVGRVEMCGLPSHNLEMYVEKLRDKYDVTIAAAQEDSNERHIYTLRSVGHEAAIDAQEAKFGADGSNVFHDPAADVTQPTVQERLEHYRPVVMAAVSEDTAYRNACGHSDRENAEIECNAAVRRAVLNSKDMELIRLFSDVPEFRNHLHQEVFDGTYERLHDLLRPLSQDDIDDALRAWNGNIESKHAVVRYMQQHGREKETAAWLASAIV